MTVVQDLIRNIGIVAHIDAGKTTVSERILFYSHKEHRIGEVDSGTATMDWMPQEQERGITITAASTTVDWVRDKRVHRINLIDTPGHVDFTAEVERTLRVLDGAVGVFCGTGGVQAQSETVWRQARRNGVPALAFVNKLDRVGSDFFRVVEAIRSRLNANAVALQIPIGAEKEFCGVVDLLELKAVRFAGAHGEEVVEETLVDGEMKNEALAWREKLVEAVADQDDEVLDRYLAGEEVPLDRLRAAIRRCTIEQKLTPVLCGAALRNKGIQPLLDAVCDYLPAPEDVGSIEAHRMNSGETIEVKLASDEPLLAFAFKTVASAHGDLVYLRLYRGQLKEGQQVVNVRTQKRERIQKMYLMHAAEREGVETIGAGNIVVLVGLKDTVTGDTLADPAQPLWLEPPRFPEAVISMAIEPMSTADRDRLLGSLEKLKREDPTFLWRNDQDTGQIVISGMGELHLEILKERLQREFGVEAAVGTPRVAYRQTVRQEASGEGIFERQIGGKSHYARVCVRVEPDPDLSAPEIVSELKKESLPLEFHPTVEEGVRSAVAAGGILGFPLTQLRATILAAESRQGEASPLAFAAAASEAFSAALEEAGAVVLEPVMRFQIETPDDYYGPISADLVQRRGAIREVTLDQGIRTLQGSVPLAEAFGYSSSLRSVSQGRASLSLEPENYTPVPPDVAARFQW